MHVISLKCLYIDIIVILAQDGLYFQLKSVDFAKQRNSHPIGRTIKFENSFCVLI